MNRGIRNAVILLAVVGLGVLTAWLLADRTTPTEASAEPSPSASNAPSVQDDRGTASAEAPERLDPNEARPESGTGEAYLDHTFRSFLESQLPELKLTPEQVNRLVADLLEFAEIQAEMHARFMQETEVTADSVTVRVPAFPVEGKGVRELLYSRLKADFPADAQRIGEQIGAYVDDVFRGFGITNQEITIKRTATADTFEVSWNATVLPGQTPSRDPQGDTYGGSSGVMLFSRDQIKAGEYRYLAPVLDRRFPTRG